MRSRLADLLRAFWQPKIALPLAGMLAYVALLVWLGRLARLWQPSLIKDTIVWAVVSGFVLFIGFAEAAEEPHFFRTRAVSALGISAFMGFFRNIYVFPLWTELVFLPLVVLLAGLFVVAGNERRHLAVKKLTTGLLYIIAATSLIFSVVELVLNWGQVDKHLLVLQLALPVWLTIGLLPFVYFLSLYATYDKAFRGINFTIDDRRRRRRAKLAILTKLHFRHREVNAFSWGWARRTAGAPSLAAARQMVSQFLEAHRDAEREAIEEQERLERYAGSDEVDEGGRRLDRREFAATMRVLELLAECQEGWYSNPGDRYRAELFEALRPQFTTQGLPADAGITVNVAENGQSWYAWRRTVSGWCFAIGAAGPPPDQWTYDGPEPPSGFPGEDSAWGSGAVSGENNRNWR
jgi:hypothetical protein